MASPLFARLLLTGGFPLTLALTAVTAVTAWGAPATVQPDQTGVGLLADGARRARFTLAEACSIARQAVPGVVVSAELEVERDGSDLEIEYEVLILKDGTLHEVEVDAVTGVVIEIEAAGDEDAGKEAVGENEAGDEGDLVLPIPTGVKLRFEDVRVGALPSGFQPAETYGVGQPGSWQVVEDPRSDRGKILSLSETKNQGRTYNLLLSDARFPARLELSVRVRADRGVEDQGGGVVWRAIDADNYYVTRWNPLEDNLRVYKVVAGDRQQLMSAKVVADPKAWHTITVSTDGPRITIGFNGKTELDLEDRTFLDPGRVGVWTKADAATSFDDLDIQ